jgi:hypothetical protein
MTCSKHVGEVFTPMAGPMALNFKRETPNWRSQLPTTSSAFKIDPQSPADSGASLRRSGFKMTIAGGRHEE